MAPPAFKRKTARPRALGPQAAHSIVLRLSQGALLWLFPGYRSQLVFLKHSELRPVSSIHTVCHYRMARKSNTQGAGTSRACGLVGGPGVVLTGTPRCDERRDEVSNGLIPRSSGSVRPTQGKTFAVMQVSGGSQSFNAVNQMRVLGRRMRMLTIPNQSSVAKAFNEFDEAGRMKPSATTDRVVDVTEELVKFTLLTRGRAAYLVDRYSDRKESAEELTKRVNLTAAAD